MRSTGWIAAGFRPTAHGASGRHRPGHRRPGPREAVGSAVVE
ncbi:hypothetical protein R0J90_04590 [Micrococcus sp. SIMBA_144]